MIQSSRRVAENRQSLTYFNNLLNAPRKCRPLWSCEEITPRLTVIKSAEQLESFLRNVVRIFHGTVRGSHLEQRWAQVALQLALSCSSRHYAGRSFQVSTSSRLIHVSYWIRSRHYAKPTHIAFMAFSAAPYVRLILPSTFSRMEVDTCSYIS